MVKKIKIKIFNFLYKIATDCKILIKNLQFFLIIKMLILYRFIRYFERYNREYESL